MVLPLVIGLVQIDFDYTPLWFSVGSKTALRVLDIIKTEEKMRCVIKAPEIFREQGLIVAGALLVP